MKKILAILLAILFVLSLTAIAASARGGGGHGHGSDYGIGEEGGYGPGGIYDTPYYEGNPNEDYAAVNQPDYAGDVYT
jgi:uncharacterized membrane protein